MARTSTRVAPPDRACGAVPNPGDDCTRKCDTKVPDVSATRVRLAGTDEIGHSDRSCRRAQRIQYRGIEGCAQLSGDADDLTKSWASRGANPLERAKDEFASPEREVEDQLCEPVRVRATVHRRPLLAFQATRPTRRCMTRREARLPQMGGVNAPPRMAGFRGTLLAGTRVAGSKAGRRGPGGPRRGGSVALRVDVSRAIATMSPSP